MAGAASACVTDGLEAFGSGTMRFVESSRRSCRFINVKNVVSTRFFISSVRGGLTMATRDNFSAVALT